MGGRRERRQTMARLPKRPPKEARRLLEQAQGQMAKDQAQDEINKVDVGVGPNWDKAH